MTWTKLNQFSQWLNSLQAVVVPMVMMLLALIIDASVLIYRAFPEMPWSFKVSASAFLGFALAFPLLLSSVNRYLLPVFFTLGKFKVGFPEVFGIVTVFMSVLFFDVFEPNIYQVTRGANLTVTAKPTQWYILVIFLSVLFGIVEYLYSHLFVEKFRELNDIYADQEAIIYWKDKTEACQQLLTSANAKLDTTTEQLKTTHGKLREAERQLNIYADKLTCQHCQQVITHVNVKNHEYSCRKNPKNVKSHADQL